jgi:DNA-binding CsgD family transcriptional regulator
MKEATLGALSKYLPIIEDLPDQLRNDLIFGLTDLRKIGVQEYGRRIIYSNGLSSMLTTSNRWVEAFNSEQLKSSMILHMSGEVLQVKKNNFNLVTRSSDKVMDEYLRALDYLGLNNSVIKYHFYKNHIEISYYVADKDDSFARDAFLNKMSLLDKLEQKLLPSLTNIQGTGRFNQEKEMVIRSDVIDTLFANYIDRNYRTEETIDNTCIDLRQKDLSYLALLGFECTNKHIAKKLGVSESTVKLDISNLKLKLNFERREELVGFANSSKIKQLVKIMNIL